jgi:GTP-binding protein
MKFVDSTQILVRAGRGGNGMVSFMAAKGKPRMGPDGGDGGRGGHVYVRGNAQLNTLSALRFRAIYRAEDGARGGTNNCRGRFGEDLWIDLPLGTQIRDVGTGALMGELIDDGQEIMVAKGGRHGLGNTHWASSTHQAPEESRPGEVGEERELSLELKLVADVGLAGFPNAGKSTLLSRVSAARPKIADYPFTTLVPNLGVVDCGDSTDYGTKSLVMADVPGLIEGAAEGRGLGHQFLKHLERTSTVVFLLDGTGDGAEGGPTPIEALTILRRELGTFSPLLAGKRSLVVISKVDAVDPDELEDRVQELKEAGDEVLAISAVSGQGLPELKHRLWRMVQEEKQRAQDDERAAQRHTEVSGAFAPSSWDDVQPIGPGTAPGGREGHAPH